MRFLLPLLLLPCALALEMTEILPDPDGNDNGLEFIELRGGENLTGCTVSDSASSDILRHVSGSGGIILIVEEDGVYNATPNATIYHSGKAIGNGLGNSADSIAISCETTLINISYNVSLIEGYAPGHSLVYDGTWSLGERGGTPGVIEEEIPLLPAVPEPAPLETLSSREEPCNTTLSIALSASDGHPGDEVLFSISSDGYASFEAESNGTVFLEGDTLRMREYGLALPESDVRISASARQCDARQRATRTIRVLPGPSESAPMNESVEVAAVPVAPQAPPEAPAQAPEEVEPITASVVYDEDSNVVPWVSAFGIVTIAVSAWLFRHMKEET